jgi:hypothetical protein
MDQQLATNDMHGLLFNIMRRDGTPMSPGELSDDTIRDMLIESVGHWEDHYRLRVVAATFP